MKANRSVYLLGLLLMLTSVAFGQSKYTISGTIKDKKSGESMIGVTVRIKELKATGTTTNEFGFYSLTIPEGTYTVIYNYVGYKPQSKNINLSKNTKVDMSFDDNSQDLNEVVVRSTREDENIKNPQAGVEKLDIKEINKLPVLMGERDVLKTIQLVPGIKSAGEGNTGFYVRGGAADQNLILLDDAPVYNASHLLGFFSTFNSDAIKDATIYKGGMPSQYGGRLSSVLDIRMNEGNNQDYHVSGGIGLISAKLNVEGPIQKDKSSFLITGRRTYADALLRLSGDDRFSNNTLYFYDLNAKANYIFSDKDRLYVSGYFGRDKLGYQDLFGLDWGNATGTLRWNHIMNSKLFSNTSLIYSDYSYKVNVKFGGTDFQIKSRIRDWTLKQEFQYFANPRNSIRFGLMSVYHTVVPGQMTASESSGITPPVLQNRYSWENALYANNTWKASEKLEVIYGLRLSAFSILGPGEFYDISNGEVTGSNTYKSGDFVKTYLNLEPRVSAAYQLNEKSSIKAAYSRTTQNMHLISNSTTSNPTDKWIPSSNNVKPEIADQGSIGYFRNFFDNKFEFSVEGYYKYMQNQIDYKDGADVTNSDKSETELLFGQGRAYGIEFFFKKKVGRFNGWIGYTLSRSEKQIDGINNNNWYAARQDRTHDISIVGIYELSKKWTLSATFVYYTGNAITFPSGKYNVDGQEVFYYTERNGYRMPDYHRLDFGATWKLRERKNSSSELAFSLYNVYGRQNAYMINFRESETNPNTTEAYQIALFRWVPSISYNFKF
jgi:hypothetical protein